MNRTIKKTILVAGLILGSVAISFSQTRSGVFRVTLNGFSVIHETKDDPLEGDGRRDEVYIVAEVWMFDKAGNSTLRRTLRSAVMGEKTTNRPERVPAGSGQPGIFGGFVGGLRTGDSFPAREPWRRTGTAFGNLDRPPLKLWEGELVQGQNVALIMPTIWEWDSNNPSNIENSWMAGIEAWVSGFHGPTFREDDFRLYGLPDNRGAKAQVVDLITRWRRDIAAVQPFGIVPVSGLFDGNRPIGTQHYAGLKPAPATFTPAALALTYDLAQDAVATSITDKGPGIFELTFRDLVWSDRDRKYVPDQDGGFYRLYVHVERVR